MPIGRQKTSSSSSAYSIGAIPRVFVHHAVLFGSEAILFFVVSIVATAASVFILSEKMHHNPFKLGSLEPYVLVEHFERKQGLLHCLLDDA